MPPCPRCGLPMTDDDGWNCCASCGIRFRFAEGGGFTFAHKTPTATDLIKDWPYFWQTMRWGGKRLDPTKRPDPNNRFYVEQGDPITTVILGFYERYREERGSCDIPEMETLQFTQYLLENIDVFEQQLAHFVAYPTPEPPEDLTNRT